MKITEPILTDEDLRIWRQLQKTAYLHSKTSRFQKKITQSEKTIIETIERVGKEKLIPRVAWSGGKDSTTMLSLVTSVCHSHGHPPIKAMSVKDDLDYPGELEYVRHISVILGVELDVVTPDASLQQWVRSHSGEIRPGADIHGRGAELSKFGFYSVIDAYNIRNRVTCSFLGLRADESHGRLMNRVTRGPVYKIKNEHVIVQPICDWSGLDVFAYLQLVGIDPLPMYRCVRLHDEPWRIRKSWWLPGDAARTGQGIWLRTYYPSLYNKAIALLPQHTSLS